MNYFTSGIHGNIEVYKDLKKLVSDRDDHLWILGDIFDGNEDHPEYCIDIFNDICRSGNISLVLGDHEYFHTLRIMLRGDEQGRDENYKDLLLSADIPGEALIDYIDSLPEDETIDIAKRLSDAEVTNMVKIGEKLFYLCHGAPSIRVNAENGIMNWQYSVVSSSLDFDMDYAIEMSSDPHVNMYQQKFTNLDFRKTILITGHTSVEEMEDEAVRQMDGVYFENKKFCLNQGYPQPNPKEWTVLGIDAAGFITLKV